jgi:alkylated DNA nucleotide flippase Atl1
MDLARAGVPAYARQLLSLVGEAGGGCPGARCRRLRPLGDAPVESQTVLDRVRAIPPGFVRTYGDVAPGAPRVAGLALSRAGDEGLPWHRVVRADGSLAKGARQRALLEAEGVPFRGERVDMRTARLPG